MKKPKILLLSLGMALCLAGAVGSALAITRTKGEATDSSSKFDQAVILYWEEEPSGQPVEIDDMPDLQTGHSDYRTLTVAPKKTKSVAGNVVLTFELEAAEEAGSVTKGITVNVYSIDALPEVTVTEENAASIIGAKTPVATINGSSETLEAETSFALEADVAAPVKYYLIEVSIGTASLSQGESVSAYLSIYQDFEYGGGN